LNILLLRDIMALIGAHLALVWLENTTQLPRSGSTESQHVVGFPRDAVFAVKSVVFALTPAFWA